MNKRQTPRIDAAIKRWRYSGGPLGLIAAYVIGGDSDPSAERYEQFAVELLGEIGYVSLWNWDTLYLHDYLLGREENNRRKRKRAEIGHDWVYEDEEQLRLTRTTKRNIARMYSILCSLIVARGLRQEIKAIMPVAV